MVNTSYPLLYPLGNDFGRKRGTEKSDNNTSSPVYTMTYGEGLKSDESVFFGWQPEGQGFKSPILH